MLIHSSKYKIWLSSLIWTVIVAVIGRLLIAFMIHIPPYDKPLRWIVEHIGSIPIMIVTGILIFIIIHKGLHTQYLQSILGAAVGKPNVTRIRRYKWFRTIRFTFMLAFLNSLALMICFVIAGHLLAYILMQYTPFGSTLVWIVNHIGSTPVIAAFGCLLFLFLFFWTSKNMISYLNEIRFGLQQMAEGKLDYEIPIVSADELSEIASSINVMSKQFNQLLQEERNAEKAKNDLITGVSHDLRTPLTSILGFLELIEQDRYQDEVELRYFVNIAYEKSKHLKSLIDDLFEYTKLNNGMPLALAKLDMIGFIRQLAEEFVPSLEKAEMGCHIITEETSLSIMADGDLLVRAFDNLVSNAIRYGHTGRQIEIRIIRSDKEALIQIVNFGEPIPAQDVSFIFDRFYRVDQSRSAESGGTGLGLAITKSIIEAHGGTISVSSSSKETIFESRFPLAYPKN